MGYIETCYNCAFLISFTELGSRYQDLPISSLGCGHFRRRRPLAIVNVSELDRQFFVFLLLSFEVRSERTLRIVYEILVKNLVNPQLQWDSG